MSRDTSRITAIDGLKGVLALAVVLYHYYLNWLSRQTDLIPGPSFLHPIWSYGALAVELFFLLSGFFMAVKYKDAIRSMSALDYSAKRLRMLKPLFFANLLAIFLIACSKTIFRGENITGHGLSVQHILLSLTFTQTGWFMAKPKPIVEPLWFVCILILCYAIYYAVVRLTKTKTAYLAACVSLACLGICLIVQKPNCPFFFYENGKGYASFFLGAVLAEVFSAKIRWNRLIPPISILLCVLYVLPVVLGAGKTFGDIRICSILFVFPCILLLGLKSQVADRILSSSPFRFLGKISLSVFATHWQVMWIWKMGYHHSTMPVSSGWFSLVFLLSVIIFATVWHETIEKRIAPRFFRFLHDSLILPSQPR